MNTAQHGHEQAKEIEPTVEDGLNLEHLSLNVTGTYVNAAFEQEYIGKVIRWTTSPRRVKAEQMTDQT